MYCVWPWYYYQAVNPANKNKFLECFANVPITVSSKNIISECSTEISSFLNVKKKEKFFLLGYVNIKGTFQFIYFLKQNGKVPKLVKFETKF